MTHYNRSRGFSLVELSIVLVILGLLVGGILAGQSLIRAAELRAVGTEYTRYVTAMYSFRDKYFALPGDFNKATSFWGDDNTNCADAAIANGTPGTCNGNADGILNWPAVGANLTGENYQFWKQLALAGLIEGTYTGLSASCYYCTVIGSNVPRSRLNNAGWTAGWVGNVTADNGQWLPSNYGNGISFGAQANYTTGAVLTTAEAWNIDTKIDDGMAARGKVLSWGPPITPNCVDTGTSAATYVLANTGVACSFQMKLPL